MIDDLIDVCGSCHCVSCSGGLCEICNGCFNLCGCSPELRRAGLWNIWIRDDALRTTLCDYLVDHSFESKDAVKTSNDIRKRLGWDGSDPDVTYKFLNIVECLKQNELESRKLFENIARKELERCLHDIIERSY